MNDTTALWAWFLFQSGLPTQRAKELLAVWKAQGLALEIALAQVPGRAHALGLTPAEAARLVPPAALPEVSAVRWDDTLYPQPLLALPQKLRPALLFSRGDPLLLTRPVLFLAPATLEEPSADGGPGDRDLLQETVALLVGEAFVMAAYEESTQAALLLEELTHGDGEAVLFARSGLDTRQPGPHEAELAEQGRLLIVSPLPPTAPHRPAWDAVMLQVAAGAAAAMLLSGHAARTPSGVPGLDDKPALAIGAGEPSEPLPPTVTRADVPVDVLTWLDTLLPAPEAGTILAAEAEPDLAGDDEPVALGPPPTAEEILTTLGRGGKIPEALRKRLLGEEE